MDSESTTIEKIMPLISVVIPAFNRGYCIQEAIQSVLDQTYENLEVIVVDDGSTDDTSTVVSAFGEKILYIHQDNGGVSSARNTGIKAARGDWIAFLDSDDQWLPEKISAQLNCIIKNPAIDICVSNVILADGSDIFHVKSNKEFLNNEVTIFTRPLITLINEQFLTSTYLIRTDSLKSTTLFDETMTLYEDLDLIARVGVCGCLAVLAKPLVHMSEIREDNLSLQHVADKFRSPSVMADLFRRLLLRTDLTAGEYKLLKSKRSAFLFILAKLSYESKEKDKGKGYLLQAMKCSPSIKMFLRVITLNILGPDLYEKLENSLRRNTVNYRRTNHLKAK